METSEPQPVVLPGERAKTVQAVEVLLRMLRTALDCYPGEDIETVMVFLTVASGSAGQVLRDPEILRTIDDGPLPDALFRPISGRAIAASCGLPRENVRRRLDQLVAQGRVVREPQGYRLRSGAITEPGNLEFGRAIIRELESAPRRLARLDPPDTD